MRIALTVFVVFSVLVVFTTLLWDPISESLAGVNLGLYSKDFFENVLVEAHGAIVDLLLVGVVLYWFENRRKTKEDIARNEELLSDLKFYRGADSAFRTLGAVKRLISSGKKELQLSEASMKDLDISDLTFSNSNLHAAVFTNSRLNKVELEKCSCDAAIFAGATLKHTKLEKCTFRRAKFQDATLKGVDFSSCRIEMADFTNANLRSAIFRDVDCANVEFRGADLQSANFIGARNVDLQSLSLAKNIKYLKSGDPEIEMMVSGRS